MSIPAEIRNQKYISLTTFRKSGIPVKTPVWFTELDGKLYVMTRNDSGKYKRIRNNAGVTIAACTVRGKVTGREFGGTAKIAPANEWKSAKQALNRKHWLARLPFWSKHNEFLEIEIGSRV